MIEKVEPINERLKSYGQTLAGKPHWRLAWAPQELETRKGEFHIFAEGTNLLLRVERGFKEVKKYPWIKDRFILERFFPPEFAFNPEIPATSLGSYECLYVFEDKDGNYLEPNERVCLFIIDQAERSKPSTEQEIIDELIKKENDEVEAILNALDTD